MKKIIISALVAIFTIALLQAQVTPKVYEVVKTKKPFKVDSNWDKKQWKKVKPIAISNFIRENPDFKPKVHAKMVYDKDNLYVIFKVEDKYVRCITDRINGSVWRDSAVEFFFSPDSEKPLQYFNLETNCGGTALMQFHANIDGKRESKQIPEEDIREIEIVASMPKIVDPEITEEVIWTIEYRIPLTVLQKHSAITTPAKGVEWEANFYKIAEITSSPHHATWSVVDLPHPTFHTPEFFGRLIFK